MRSAAYLADVSSMWIPSFLSPHCSCIVSGDWLDALTRPIRNAGTSDDSRRNTTLFCLKFNLKIRTKSEKALSLKI